MFGINQNPGQWCADNFSDDILGSGPGNNSILYLPVRTIIDHKIQLWLCFYPWQTHEYMSNNGQTAMMRKHIKWCTNKVQASVVPRLSSVMEANEKKAILNCFKWLAFILCLFAFLWKTTDSFITYFDKDIGTKITLHRNYEADLPEFAICRHPNRYLKKDKS